MEADISIWRKTGHFYFALTTEDHENRATNNASLESRLLTQGLRIAKVGSSNDRTTSHTNQESR